MTTVEEKAIEFENKIRDIIKNEPYETATKLRVQRLWNSYFVKGVKIQIPPVFIYFMRNEAVNSIRDVVLEEMCENEDLHNHVKETTIQEYGHADLSMRIDGFCYGGLNEYLIYVTKGTREFEDNILKHELGHVIENTIQKLIDSKRIEFLTFNGEDCNLSKPFLVHEYKD
jgi:hypothetical protein